MIKKKVTYYDDKNGLEYTFPPVKERIRRKSNRWLVCIDGSGYMTAFTADQYRERSSRYRDFVPFCQIRNATEAQIRFAMVWAVHNLRA